MKNVFNAIAKWISSVWWTVWSTLRWRHAIRHNIGIAKEDRIDKFSDIGELLKRLMKHFDYTEDGFDQLWDSITPPPQVYQFYLDGVVKDDCDGFHSLVYHVLYNNSITCYLLSAVAYDGGHCILLFKYNDLWHVIDYTRIYEGHKTAEEAINAYNEIYPTKYKTKPVAFNHLVGYDYEKGKFTWFTLNEIEK